MERQLINSGTTWLGLTFVSLAMVGLMSRIHSQQTAMLPVAMEAAAAEAVLGPVLEARTDPTHSPAQDGIHHRRPALSMPYFSFARLLRPGS